jgi:hypothetical protein
MNFTYQQQQQLQQPRPMAFSAAAPPSLLTQVVMAGTAAVITVTFIHPIDVVKVCIYTLHKAQAVGLGRKLTESLCATSRHATANNSLVRKS